jgi:DNA-binding XRE family transcriptional regulator
MVYYIGGISIMVIFIIERRDKMKKHVYSNLDAEQARKGWTDAEVAGKIGIVSNTYSQKKKRGSFKISECIALCKLFGCEFDYLFSNAPQHHQTV